MISIIIIGILIGFIIGILLYFLVPQKKKFDDGFNLAIKDIGKAAEESYKKELQEKTLKIEQDIAAIEEKKNNLSKKYQDAILEFENDYKNKTEDKKLAIEKIMQEQIQEMKAENEKQRIEIDKQKKEIFDNYGEVVKEYEEKKTRAKEKYDKVIFLGDYVTTHELISDEQQLSNFIDILNFKRDNSDLLNLNLTSLTLTSLILDKNEDLIIK